MLAAMGLFGWGVSAQTTFNVDMTCAPEGFTDVFVTGPWCGWCANDVYNTMTDDDGDGIYSVTVADLTGTVEYKYAINGFDDQENLINDMVDGATCAPVTDFSGYANRTTEARPTMCMARVMARATMPHLRTKWMSRSKWTSTTIVVRMARST